MKKLLTFFIVMGGCALAFYSSVQAAKLPPVKGAILFRWGTYGFPFSPTYGPMLR